MPLLPAIIRVVR